MAEETTTRDLGHVVRRIADGINSKDLAAIQSVCDLAIEYTSSFSAIDGGTTYRGLAGWSDYLADLDAAWKVFRITIEEFVPAKPEKLVAVLRSNALARGSGVPVDQRVYAAWEFRDGKALRGADLYEPGRGSQSRGAAGVGDVAAERAR
jgi:ketosteroid isomerase-like protein